MNHTDYIQTVAKTTNKVNDIKYILKILSQIPVLNIKSKAINMETISCVRCEKLS